MKVFIDTVENGESFIYDYDEYTMAGKAIVGSKVRVLVDPNADNLAYAYEYFPINTIVEVIK